MTEPDVTFLQRDLDALKKELREGLALMELRDQAREASYQAMMQTVSRQLVTVATAVEERLTSLEVAFNGRADRAEERLDRIEGLLVDIARKLDA